ncbi:hypothetical protein SFRURICE_020077 [Spodoptera frugiperda]|nr:hypothetical protein SFRURICE_020077 [Spodoptera frugiperda]
MSLRWRLLTIRNYPLKNTARQVSRAPQRAIRPPQMGPSRADARPGAADNLASWLGPCFESRSGYGVFFSHISYEHNTGGERMNDFVRANSDVAKSGIGPQSWETFVDTASTENRLFTTKSHPAPDCLNLVSSGGPRVEGA